MLLTSQLVHLKHICLFFELHAHFKAAHLECWFASFPGDLNLKGFLHFPYLENKNPKHNSAFNRIRDIYRQWKRFLAYLNDGADPCRYEDQQAGLLVK